MVDKKPLTLHQAIRKLRTEEDARVIDILFHLHLGMDTKETVSTTLTTVMSWFEIPGTAVELGVLPESLSIQRLSTNSPVQLAYQVPSDDSLLYWHATVVFLATLRKVGSGY